MKSSKFGNTQLRFVAHTSRLANNDGRRSPEHLIIDVIDVVVDHHLWRLDRSRADERKALGIEMLTLGRNLGHFVGRINGDPMSAFRPQITSCLTKVKRFGMWVPDD